MLFNARRVILVALGLTLSACVTRSDVEEIRGNQQKIMAKLDALQRGGAAQPARQRPRGPDPSKVYSYSVDNAPVKGPADAWVTVIEISDFQCPFCKRASDTLHELEKEYGNEVRFVFKNNPLPFHNRAMPAAVAAGCAQEQGRFWQMHDLLFANQSKLDDAALEDYAKQVGVDMGRWKACVASGKPRAAIAADAQRAAQLQATGTPAFFINGRFLSGAQPAANFKALIDAELSKAKASGVAKREYYAKQVVEKGEKTL